MQEGNSQFAIKSFVLLLRLPTKMKSLLLYIYHVSIKAHLFQYIIG